MGVATGVATAELPDRRGKSARDIQRNPDPALDLLQDTMLLIALRKEVVALDQQV